MERKLTNKDFYFCYDRKLSKTLKEEGFSFIVHAFAGSTHKEFWLYHRTPELEKLIIR